MGLRTTAALTGLVGGLTWIAALVVEQTSGNDSIADVLTWAGLFLLGIATLGAGASLVSRSATWLRVIVAVCFAVLVWSVLELLADSFDGATVYAVFGGVAVVVAIVVLARSKRAAKASGHSHRASGTHAR